MAIKNSLAVKYRPKVFDEVVEQDAIKQILMQELKSDNIKRCLLFTGGAGTGKTTNARIYANEVEPNPTNIIEINCADHTGVDDVRSLIINESRVKPLLGKYKVFILDECFYGNTLISTPQGNKQIKDIHVGDFVYNMTGCGRVSNTLKHNIPLHRITIVTINGKQIITTKDHLFFTNNGWIEASKLQAGDIVYGTKCIQKDLENLSSMPHKISSVCRKQQQDILHTTMPAFVCANKTTIKETTKQTAQQEGDMLCLSKGILGTAHIDSQNVLLPMQEFVNKQNRTTIHEHTQGATTHTTIKTAHEVKQSYDAQKMCGQNETNQKEQWNVTRLESSKRWQWNIYNTAAPIMASIKPTANFGICSKNRTLEKNISMAYQLQIRPCLSRQNVGDRGGWQIPHIEKQFIERQEKNGLSGNVRVDSVEVYQSTNRQRLLQCGISDKEISQGYVEMYDLEVENNPSYFVNDTLVHNCHMLTSQSQNALLKLLEEPPAYCIYIMCTTDPQKVLSTILSRAFRYDFQLISHKGIVDRLNYILTQEKQENANTVNSWTFDALAYIATACKGHMRDAITTTDKLLSYTKDITVEAVEKVLGVTSYELLFQTLDAILNKDQNALITTINNLVQTGMDLKLYIKTFLQFVLDVNKYVIMKSETQTVNLTLTNIPPNYEQRLMCYTAAHKPALKSLLHNLLELNSNIRWETDVRSVLESNLLLEVM